MLGMRSFAACAVLAVAVALVLSGCPEDVGVTLLVSPDKLDFGATKTVMSFLASKNFSGTTLGPVVVKSSAPWIIPEACTDAANQCLSGGPIDRMEIPVRIDRSQTTLGTNRGYVLLEGGGVSSEKVEVVATDLLQVDFSVATRTPELGRSVQFSDLSLTTEAAGAITRHRWDFGDGTTSDEVNPAHIYTTAGEYTVTLSVWAGSRTESLARPAYVMAGSTPPIAGFSASATTITERDEVTFYDLTTSSAAPVVERVWDFGDGHTSHDARPVIQYANPGLYTVSLTVTTSLGASDTETKTNYIIVQQAVAPTAKFALSRVSPYVLVPVQFTDLSDPGTAPILDWVWDFGDSVISTEQNPTHVYRAVGEVEVRLTVITEHGIHTSATKVQVTNKPPIADFEADNTNPSTDEAVAFTDKSLPGLSPDGVAEVDLWWWDFGDGKTSRVQNPSHAYEREGDYTVTLKVGSTALPPDVTGEKVLTNYIRVFSPPVPAFEVDNDSPFTKDVLTFTNATTAGTEATLRYEWDFGDDSDVVTEANPTHVYTDPGTYTIALKAITPTRSATIKQNLVVDARPVPDFSATPTVGITVDPVQFTDETPTAHVRPVETRLWSFGDGGISTGQNPTHLYATLGIYSVSLKVTYSHSVSHKVFDSTAVKANYIRIALPVPPTAAFSLGSACVTPGEQIQFTDTSDPGSAAGIATHLWDFGDGQTSTQANPRHAYAHVGDYTVTLSVTTDARYAPYNTSSVTQENVINCHHQTTALDEYVAADDGSFDYSVVSSAQIPVSLPAGDKTVTAHVVDLTSQTWRSLADYRVVGTNSAEWKHYMTVVSPSANSSEPITRDTALLFIDGGGNGGGAPDPASTDETLLLIAAATDSVVIDLKQVPNESVEFTEEAGLRTRSEDEIISYTYNQWLNAYSNGGDPADYNSWPLLLPMVKSAVRAMDAVQDMYTGRMHPAVLPPTTTPTSPVRKFVVSGGSKRGWTTWLTGAFESGPLGAGRVKAIAPIVIDILNMPKQLEHHFSAYGYWSPAIYPYAQEQVFDRFAEDHPQHAAGLELLEIVDPYKYRCRMDDLPKYIMNSAGDEFFLPDAAQWSFAQLPGEKFLNYVPNSSHGLGDFTDLSDPNNPVSGLASFYASMLPDVFVRPSFRWSFEPDGSILVTVERGAVRSVKLWTSTNPSGRDFRLYKGHLWNSTPLIAESTGRYRASVTLPASGYTAFFVQLSFTSTLAAPANAFPFFYTTPIRVLPENPDGSNKYPVFTGARHTVGTGVNAVPLVVVRGTPREMGRQYGELMDAEIHDHIPSFLVRAQLKYPSMTNAALDAVWETIAQSYDPAASGAMSRFEDELIGVAEGAGLYDESNPSDNGGLLMLRRANMVPVLASMNGLAIGTTRDSVANGYTLQSFGLNWALDLGLQDFPCIVMYVPDVAHGFPHANVTFAGMVGALTGVSLSGVALSGLQDPSLPGDPGPFSLAGTHFSTVIRDALYDARNIRDAVNTFVQHPLFLRQHLVASDGRYFRQNAKARINGPEGFPGFMVWSEDDPADEYAPHTLPFTVYAGPRSGAVNPDDTDGPVIAALNAALGHITPAVMEEATNLAVNPGSNLMSVVYEAPSDDLVLNIHVAYANGTAPAAEQTMAVVNLQDYLP